MSEAVSVKVEEVKELFEFLDRLNYIYHSEERMRDTRLVEQFWLHGGYTDLHRLFYDVVWKWLPPEVQKEIEEA